MYIVLVRFRTEGFVSDILRMGSELVAGSRGLAGVQAATFMTGWQVVVVGGGSRGGGDDGRHRCKGA